MVVRALPSARTPKQRAGDEAEEAAARHLMASGCRILARNARYRDGEVDLIAGEREIVVFVEVRMRTGSRFGGAAVSVGLIKRQRIARAAQHGSSPHTGSAGRPAASMSSPSTAMAQSNG